VSAQAAAATDRALPPLLPAGGRRDPVLALAVMVVAALVLMAAAAPWIAPHQPDAINILGAYQGSSGTHLLGTDSLGRDILSRLIYGARLSLLGPALVILIATGVGTVIAISSAWLGGWPDTVISRVLDILFAFPGLIFAMIAVAIFGSGLTAPVIALSIAYLPYIARVVRGTALRERNMPYISACHVEGVRTGAILFRHLLPNIFPIVVVQATLSFGSALVDLAAISYLGLGVQPPTPEWGLMASTGQASILAGHPAESLYACIMIIIAVVAFNVMGERLAARFGSGS
jgi:peptide/nickel transport system permease protein